MNVQTDRFSTSRKRRVFPLSKTQNGIVGVFWNGQFRDDYIAAKRNVRVLFALNKGDVLHIVYLVKDRNDRSSS